MQCVMSYSDVIYCVTALVRIMHLIRVFYFTPFLPDSELVRFAGAVLSLLGH